MKIELKYIRAETASTVDRWQAHITDIEKNEFTIIELGKVEYEAFLFLQSQPKQAKDEINGLLVQMRAQTEAINELQKENNSLRMEIDSLRK